jgi:hypothetical protein
MIKQLLSVWVTERLQAAEAELEEKTKAFRASKKSFDRDALRLTEMHIEYRIAREIEAETCAHLRSLCAASEVGGTDGNSAPRIALLLLRPLLLRQPQHLLHPHLRQHFRRSLHCPRR